MRMLEDTSFDSSLATHFPIFQKYLRRKVALESHGEQLLLSLHTDYIQIILAGV